MMNKITSFLSRLGRSRKFWLVASLVLSFLIWYGFKQYYNPTSTRNLRDVPISFDVSNTAVSTNNLEIITHSADSVEVVITGKTANIMKVSATDLTITPSLKDISKPGEYTVALNYSKSSIFSDFDVVSINPKTVDILVDSVATRTFDKLVAEANGITAPTSSGLIKEMPYITDGSNGTLTVSGAQSKVDKIHTVVLRTDEIKEISAVLSCIQKDDEVWLEFFRDGHSIELTGKARLEPLKQTIYVGAFEISFDDIKKIKKI